MTISWPVLASGDADGASFTTVDAPVPAIAASFPHLKPIPASVLLPQSEEFRTAFEPCAYLGGGGMADVVLMYQKRLDRLVAVKLVKADALSKAEARRLQKEAQVLAKLSHPSIVGVYDVRIDGDVPYMVHEYMEGGTLRDRLRRGPALTLAQILDICVAILEGLIAAGKKGIVHRDLKPENILLTHDGVPKIADFGLAKAQDIPGSVSIGKLVGTPHYMSPEQCGGQHTTSASDAYAVGVMLFEMLTGRRPFAGPGLIELLAQHATHPIPPIESATLNVPPDLERLITQALAKRPVDRPRTVEFRRALLEIVESTRVSVGAPMVPVPRLVPALDPISGDSGWTPVAWLIGVLAAIVKALFK